MAYSEELAAEIREVLKGKRGITEKKMFGGLAFFVNGNMACGVHKDELVVRVSKDDYDEYLEDDHARPFDITGKPLTGFLLIDEEASVETWVDRSLEHATSLPKK